ncbi:MAG: serine/threonine dehydratase [Planctomycetaceae bacterium]|nr:serine/threonine dehydratase [Planctomycetaceae bacterium]
MAWPITIQDVEQAARDIHQHLAPTALRHYRALDQLTGLRLLVKHENHQPTNAFKIRNALAAMSRLTDDQKQRGVIVTTSGNFGFGSAWAGRALGIRIVACVAEVGVTADRIDMLRELGAEVVKKGRDYDEATLETKRLVQERGLTEIHGIDHPLIPAGAGSITLEMLAQAEAMGESIDAIVFAIGGGSQAVGGMTVLRARGIDIPVYGVQAAGASAQHDSYHAGQPIPTDTPTTFATGLATRDVYDLTFRPLCEGLTDFVLADDAELAEAMRLMIEGTHNLVEPSGAAGLAGALKLADQLAGKTVAIVLSGSNIDTVTLTRVLNRQI